MSLHSPLSAVLLASPVSMSYALRSESSLDVADLGRARREPLDLAVLDEELGEVLAVSPGFPPNSHLDADVPNRCLPRRARRSL